jgi:sigma-70-like protein
MIHEEARADSVILGSDGRMDYHLIPRPWRNHARMVHSPDRESQAIGTSTPDQQQDLELIRAVASRDQRAFERLYYRHSPRLGRYLMRLLRQPDAVEEALNDVMLVIWQNSARLDPAVSRLTTWLFGIAHNKALKMHAHRRARSAEIRL